MTVVRFGEKSREFAMFCQFWKLKLLFMDTVYSYVEIDRNSTVMRGNANDDFTLNLW
ncbi:hypothetical protein SLEP1_g41106 [Rubroshorea leprosula]|uniref:Uncharacterized protein n=1 Tax=Rubroshorea leprosula TaxID=152421 RepID=A0AAV5L5T3_9ROSI|nr:hypothetical protein SLEP1_g41106 [Rubroshorea leprosula]